MNIYIMLPFVDVKSDQEYMHRTARLTEDYKEQFKTKAVLYYVQIGVVAKRSRYDGGRQWAYTRIQPETLKLH